MKDEIAEDIETVLEFVRSLGDFGDHLKPAFEAVNRVEAYLATYRDDHMERRTARKFNLVQQVRTPEGYVGHITGYDDGRLNIKVTFEHHSLWYNEDELTAV